MIEYVYTVSDGHTLLGTFVDINTAAIFVKAYFAEYYNDPFGLTIRRVPKNEEEADETNRR